MGEIHSYFPNLLGFVNLFQTPFFVFMKIILLFLVWMIGWTGFSQQKSLYTNEPYKKSIDIEEHRYLVSFKKSMYRLTFNNDTPKFLKPLISRFIEKKHRNYTDLGIYNVTVLRKNGDYFLVERDTPEKLFLLK